MMKKIFLVLLLFLAVRSFGQGFPSTDSLHRYDNRFITNSAINAFTDYRLNTLLHGMINWIDSARLGTGGTVGVDTLYALNDSTLRYKKNGVFYNFVFKGVYDFRRKVDTIYRKPGQDSIFFKVNGTERGIKDSTGGSTNSNIGSGFRLAVPGTNNIKTLFAGNCVTIDSTSNTNGITFIADTACLSTYYLRRKDSVLYVTQTKLNDTAAAIRAAVGGGGGATDISITQNLTNTVTHSSTGLDGTTTYATTAVAGVLSPRSSDIGHLPEIKHYMAAKGLQAPNTYSVNYYPYSIDSVPYKFSTTRLGSNGHEYGGWLTPNLTGDSVQVRAPFCVVAGDSQAEGHPGRHGRLDPNGSSGFNAAYPDSTGQLSYHLRFLTNMRWVNHGIGGQTTTQLRRRFMRDVVGVPGTYSGDNKGNQTLWYKPQVAVIIIGINDVATGADIQLVKENFEWMASTLQQEGIRGVFLNLPGDEVMDSAFSYKIETINRWLNEGALDQYNATIVDYNSWWRDPTYNDNFHASSLIVDDIHPSQVGYDSLANFILRSAHLPVLKRAIFVNELDPGGFTGYSRPTGFTIGNAPGYTPTAYTIANSTDSVNITAPVWDSTWIKITASTNITGTTYTGFSSIYWYLENNIDTLRVTKRTTYNNGSQKPKSFFSNIKIVPPDFSAQKVIDVRLSDVTTNIGFELFTDAGSCYAILNPLAVASNTRLNNSFLSIYATGATAIGTNGNIIATGTKHRFGELEIGTNGVGSTFGYGIFADNTASGMSYQSSPAGAKSHHVFEYYFSSLTASNTSLGAGASSVTDLIRVRMGLGNSNNTNQIGNVINLTPTYNQTVAQTGTQFNGLRYVPIETSLTNTKHRFLLQSTGDNYLNAVGGSTGIGIDSNTTLTARLHLGAGTATASTAPLKFTSGTNLTTAEAGAMEYNGTSLFFSPSTTRLRTVLTDNSIPSNGQIPIGNGTNYTNANITSTGSTITVTNGAGTINLDIPSTVLANGPYTPTLTNVTNISSSALVKASYTRIGTTVTVYVEVTIDPTGLGATELGITLPVASNLIVPGDLIGLGNCAAVPAQAGVAAPDATNERATFSFTASDTNSQSFYITFQYQIIAS